MQAAPPNYQQILDRTESDSLVPPSLFDDYVVHSRANDIETLVRKLMPPVDNNVKAKSITSG
jgi:hypothetical protein